jgi:hypothetical protein
MKTLSARETAFWNAYDGRIALLLTPEFRKGQSGAYAAQQLVERLAHKGFAMQGTILVQAVGSNQTEAGLSSGNTIDPIRFAGHVHDVINEHTEARAEQPHRFRVLTKPDDAWEVFDVAAPHVLDLRSGVAPREQLGFIAVASPSDITGTRLGLHVSPDGLALPARLVADEPTARNAPFTFRPQT